MAQPHLVKSFRLAVDQLLKPESLNESLELALGHRLLGQVDEVRLDATLGKESLCLAGVGAFLDPKDLNFHAR